SKSALESTFSAVAALIERAGQLRLALARAAENHERISADLLTVAFSMAFAATKDQKEKDKIWHEAKCLGAKRNSRSTIGHAVSDICFPPGTISAATRTRNAQAVMAGIELGLTVEQFRETAIKGSSGKGGITELANRLRRRGTTAKSPFVASTKVDLADAV